MGSEQIPKSEDNKFDYRRCYNCDHTIYVIGEKFCSDFCKESYQTKLKKKFS